MDLVWCFFAAIMMLLGALGLMMKEFAALRIQNNTTLKFKIPVSMALQAVFYFWVGIGFTIEVEGGLLGYEHVFGYLPEKDYHQMFCTYFPISVIMTALATMSIADRARPDTHLFYTIVSSTLISPIIMAWTWGDGWLHKRGFHDFAGASTFHLTAGVSALVASVVIGPSLRSHFKQKVETFMQANWSGEAKLEAEPVDTEKDLTYIGASEWHRSNTSNLSRSDLVDNIQPGRLWRNKEFAPQTDGADTPNEMVNIKLLPKP